MGKSENILKNAKIMHDAAGNGIGPDVVIIVNSSNEQASFWQERLTGEDKIYSSGAVTKEGSLVLSVTESNWSGGAGNGLGTLNGFVQAGRKAREFGTINIPENASVREISDSFLEYLNGKSVFMVHTAGKGTRIAPIPGCECNSKSNIKLPSMIDVSGRKEPITILEAVLEVISIYAPSRKDRLSVFWGDQIIINERDISFSGAHHVELFGELVPLTDEIKSYGVLIPSDGDDCRIREKFLKKEILKLLPPGEAKVYRSLGSFTVSLPFLYELIRLEEEALIRDEGGLNTDPDWWQPLTSMKDEYIDSMAKKGISGDEAGSRWETMNQLWEDFSQSDSFKASGLDRKIGFKDVGENSLWWDYGQNEYYLRNMQLLTSDTTEGEAARIFFGVKDEWIKDSETGEVRIENCIIQSSQIGKGSLKNSVVIASDLAEVNAEDAIIMGSTVLKLNDRGALCYNVVDEEVTLTENEILVNVFHPEKGRIPMRTDTKRDGKSDWDGKEHVTGNAYTYPEIAEMMKGIKASDVERLKKEESERLTK